MNITSINIEYVVVSAEDETIIEKIGGIHPNGIPWEISIKRAIEAITAGIWNFHVMANGFFDPVIIAKRKGHKHLKGLSDKINENSLLRLPNHAAMI